MKNELSLRLEHISRKNKKDKVVLFFGRETFSDNTKYLYLKALEEQRDYTCIWCSCEKTLINSLKEKNLPCHLIDADSFEETMRLFLSAAVAVFSVNPAQSLNESEELFACLHGARHIQLWHGVSVKHLLLMKHLSLADYNFRRPVAFASRADTVLSPSSCLDSFFNESFGCKRIIRAGYPRNEVILRGATKLESIGSELPKEMFQALQNNKRKKILFTPTWQRGATQLLTGSPEFLGKLALVCQKNNADLYLKAHPTLLQDKSSGKLSGNVYYINPTIDIYPYLNKFDALITDYSSIMFDFLLTQKPILRLDIQEGTHKSFEPDFGLVPDIAFAYLFTDKTLPAVLSQALIHDCKQDERQKMADALFETDPLQSASALVKFLQNEVNACVASSHDFYVEHY
ncbi:CDP-glycerol glycerophosphotransferase family protein [Scandinavium sp. TWS1a]|uniref:CDP-glycerol glycerophosphotransferase family protein n=1 Tax=Scandinavium tedordense TaxID=2926521 RepID=UPI0021665470|nr:CDP-glycerol glycerophosphotransferase family protein [Scandinavium tedordense]MCS2170663.1 CDP-glycerol glycerophosphotransferase family protein [Scandinavium tedordense]